MRGFLGIVFFMPGIKGLKGNPDGVIIYHYKNESDFEKTKNHNGVRDWMKKTFPKTGLLPLGGLAAGALAGWIAWGNTALVLTTYTLSSGKLPRQFSGCCIAQISDLHNAQLGNGNQKLLGILKRAKPDLIAITGDLIDSRRTDLPVALDFAAEAGKIAPCYYVPGNHEARVPEYGRLKAGLEDRGIVVLTDEAVTIPRAGAEITLLGVEDPSFQTRDLRGRAKDVMRSKLQGLTGTEAPYTILLSHRPELFPVYQEQGVDLVLSGHTHGGQFRLPWVGGLLAPGQGLHPKYDGGCYTQGATTMVVSRGIGNSLFPFRFNNRPEVVLVRLKQAP